MMTSTQRKDKKAVDEVNRLHTENQRLKSLSRNLEFINIALQKACSELTQENLKLRIDNDTLRLETDALRSDSNGLAKKI